MVAGERLAPAAPVAVADPVLAKRRRSLVRFVARYRMLSFFVVIFVLPI